MFEKLRMKFIAITMAMVAVVMALAFTAVCAIEYQRSYSVVQTALSDAVEQASVDAMKNGVREGVLFEGVQETRWGYRSIQSDGSSSSSQGSDTDNSAVDASAGADASTSEQGASNSAGDAAEAADDTATSSGDSTAAGGSVSSKAFGNGSGWDSGREAGYYDEAAAASEQGGAPPFIGRRDGRERSSSSLIPVAVYESRSDAQEHIVPQVTTASISEDVLNEALGRVREANEGTGMLGDLNLYYSKRVVGECTYFVFTDTSYTDTWKTLAIMLVVVGLATLVVFFVISLFYSRWALKPVREAWDSQRQFVADASHDLKTPITVVLANAAILLKHPERTIASESQWIESTQREAENMQGLVNEMLELAQVEAGEKAPVEKEPIDFSDLVDGETLMFDAVALERNCAFDCQIQPGVTIVGNEKQVNKMVSTLVENAFKYVDAGGSVNIDLRTAGKNAQLSIRNTGSVISEADLPHIFDRFYRTDKARTSGEGGFGLGLAIAREIARQHDGDITCTSNESEGTTFTVTLPL